MHAKARRGVSAAFTSSLCTREPRVVLWARAIPSLGLGNTTKELALAKLQVAPTYRVRLRLNAQRYTC